MEFHLWLSLVLICVLGALSPGPSLALVIRNTLTAGKQQGMATAISHGVGVGLYAVLTVTGLGLMVVKSQWLFQLVQYLGAAFLVFLAIKALTSKTSQIDKSLEEQTIISVNGWRDGFFIAFLNPKLAIFFLALFSQFVEADASWQQKSLMAGTVAIIDTLWYCLVVFIFSRSKVLDKLKNKTPIIDKITGVVLLALAGRVLV